MDSILLILVLFSDPASQATATLLAEELVQRGGKQVQVVVGAEAMKRLEVKGLRDGDLLAGPHLAEQLTASEPQLIVIRLEHRVVTGDQIIESRVWSSGRSDSHTAIAGKGTDPSASAVAGVMELVAPRLVSVATPGDPRSGELPALVQRQAWHEMEELLAARPDKTPREYYYLVLAQVRLRRTAAKDTVAAMAKAHPGHFMVTAAASLLPGEPEGPRHETKLEQ